jgi:hypothetical protein
MLRGRTESAAKISRHDGAVDRRHFQRRLEEACRQDSVQNPPRSPVNLDGIANGLRPWFTKFAGSVNDARWLRPVEEVYTWCAANERYLRQERSLARVGLVYSQQTAWFAGGDRGGRDLEDAANGWYHALIEARVPFEMVHDRLLDAAHLSQFKTLILPSIAALSDAQCAQLRAFVERGGGLVATHETSLYDEWGVRRESNPSGVRPSRDAERFFDSSTTRCPGIRCSRGSKNPWCHALEVAAWRCSTCRRIPGLQKTPRTDIPQVFLADGRRGGGVFPIRHRPYVLGVSTRSSSCCATPS